VDFGGGPKVHGRHRSRSTRAERTLAPSRMNCRRVWRRICFWLGRYSERCEDKARLLRANGWAYAPTWPVAAGARNVPAFHRHAERSAMQDYRVRRRQPPGTARRSAAFAMVRGTDAQPAVGREWRAISVLQRQFQEAAERKRDPRETLDALLLSLAALAGFALDDMTARTTDGGSLMLGRRLERMQFLGGSFLGQSLKSGATPTQSELEWCSDIGDSTSPIAPAIWHRRFWGSTIDLLVFENQPTRPRVSVEPYAVFVGADRCVAGGHSG